MSETKVLVKYDACYADEFDITGFRVMDKSEWENHKAKVTEFFDNIATGDEVEAYFGTNECMIYDSLDSYLGFFDVVDITAEEIKSLQKFFGEDPRSGMVVMIDDDTLSGVEY